MYRHLVDELVLFSVIVYLAQSKESALYCPNSRLPEFDHDGVIKQCLPGQEGVCGPGYACFFSGTNYQCCPSEEESKLDPIIECPPSSMTILTDAGLPLTCIPGLRDCPQSTMQCVDVVEHSICCERSSIVEQSDGVLPLTELSGPDEELEPIESSNEIFGASSLECPEPAFTMLDGNGDPLQCDEEDCAHQAGRFCYKTLGTPICCEGEERAIDEDELIKKFLQESRRETVERAQWNPLKYSLRTTTTRQKQRQSKLPQNKNRSAFAVSNLFASVSKAPLVDGSTFEEEQHELKVSLPAVDEIAGLKLSGAEEQRLSSHDKNVKTLSVAADVKATAVRQKNVSPSPISSLTTTVGTSSTTIVPSTRSITTTSSTTTTTTTTTTATTTTTSVTNTPTTTSKPELPRKQEKKIQQQRSPSILGESQEIRAETIRYKPHSAGGYAVSRTFSTKIRRAPEDARALAREYLLEQIRRGWPYSEEFYRAYVPFNSRSHPPGAEVIFHQRT